MALAHSNSNQLRSVTRILHEVASHARDNGARRRIRNQGAKSQYSASPLTVFQRENSSGKSGSPIRLLYSLAMAPRRNVTTKSSGDSGRSMPNAVCRNGQLERPIGRVFARIKMATTDSCYIGLNVDGTILRRARAQSMGAIDEISSSVQYLVLRRAHPSIIGDRISSRFSEFACCKFDIVPTSSSPRRAAPSRATLASTR